MARQVGQNKRAPDSKPLHILFYCKHLFLPLKYVTIFNKKNNKGMSILHPSWNPSLSLGGESFFYSEFCTSAFLHVRFEFA